MNFQKAPPQELIDLLEKSGFDLFNLSYYAWPQMFGSTAGPHGGIGGQSMSEFTVEAWVQNNEGPTLFVCGRMFFFDTEKFEMFKQIRRWHPIPSKNSNQEDEV